MRAIVLCLLLANVLYMAWHHWIRLPDVPVPQAASARLPSLTVAAERPVRPAPPSTEPKAPPRRCHSLGPFPNPAAARVLADQLSSSGIESVLRSRDAEVSGGWWVYLGPERTREAARETTDRLAAAGLDEYYIVPSGDMRNAISLGVFRERGRAEYQAAEAQRLGFDPSLIERTVTESAFWLDFEAQAVPLGRDDLETGEGPTLRLDERPCPPPGQQSDDEENQWARFR